MQRGNEVGIDLKRVPELDDRLVVLPLPQEGLATLECLLLLRLGTLDTGREHENEQSEHGDPASAASDEEA